jgi:cytochrome c oxidase assembly protein subunit 15
MSSATLTISPPKTARLRQNKPVALWLFAVAFMIWVMAGIGGYTRDTGSGLSIMNWDPIIGTLPPMSDAAWAKIFALYQTIPQYHLEHQGMDLADFKTMFWPEYIHRLWGRLIGVVFFVPLVYFAATKKIEKRLIPWLVLLFILGGLQGAIGWFMVASGFDPNSTAVEPWRLTLHFTAAILLLLGVFWTALTLWRPEPAARQPATPALRYWAIAALVCLAFTMAAGTFVSGTHAIDVFNAQTGAGMGPPQNYFALTPWWMNLFANKSAILFDHQVLGTLTAITVIGTAVVALRGGAAGAVRDAALAIFALVILQYVLGVTALVSKLLDVGVAHQMNGVALLACLTWLLHALRGARR